MASNGDKERAFVFVFLRFDELLASLFYVLKLLLEPFDFPGVHDNSLQKLLFGLKLFPSELFLSPELQIVFFAVFVFFLAHDSIVKGFISRGELLLSHWKFMHVFSLLDFWLLLEFAQMIFPNLLLFHCLELWKLLSFEGEFLLFFDVMQVIYSQSLVDRLFQHLSFHDCLKSIRLYFMVESIFQVLSILLFEVFQVGVETFEPFAELFIFLRKLLME